MSDLAELIEVEARDLWVGDVVGEGQKLWAVQHDFATNIVSAHWGGVQDDDHKLTWPARAIVHVVRNELWLTALDTAQRRPTGV